jgi:predicted GIY-YIG superfamily endonuclease
VLKNPKTEIVSSSNDVTAAMAREKQIKGLLRSKKIELKKSINPEFRDLSESWFDAGINELSPPP